MLKSNSKAVPIFRRTDLDHNQARKRLARASGCAALLLLASYSRADVLPVGTKLEVRLLTAVGSRSSRIGDPVKAVVIAPILVEHRPLLLEGASLSGVVEKVEPLGLGLRRAVAQIKLRFDWIRLTNGTVLPIHGRVQEVETARERVDSDGNICGILPTANLSSGVSFAISTFLVDTEFVAPAIAIKLLAARSPDSEIYLPAGAELFVQLTKDIVISQASPTSETTPALTSNDLEEVQHLLSGLPVQQTSLGRKHSSDLINLLILGSADHINAAFRAAGWNGESRHSVLALYRIYHCLVQRMGYSMAPMSRLTLNGLAASTAYQKSLDTLARRHHIRLWDEANSNAWLGAASEDVGFTVRNMHVTHAIDPQIDNERAKVINDLWFTGCVRGASLLSRASLKTVAETGFSITTDGDIAVLRMNNCDHPRTVPKSTPTIRQRPRIAQAFIAVATDIARANPLTVTCIAFRSVAGWNKRKTNLGETLHAQGWLRPTVINSRSEETRQSIANSTQGRHGKEAQAFP